MNILGAEVEKAIKTLVFRIAPLPTELKIRALKAVENLLLAETVSSEVAVITLKWFKAMDNNIIDKIVSYAKNPFGEIRYAGLGVLHSLASQQWGQEVIQNVPGKILFSNASTEV